MQKAMKGKAVVAAGLTAVLALTPVAGPVGVAFADDSDQTTAGEEAQYSIQVDVFGDGSSFSEYTLPRDAAGITQMATDLAPEGKEFAGTWTVVGNDGTKSEGKTLDELAGNFGNVKSLQAEFKDAPVAQETVDLTYQITDPGTEAYSEIVSTADENGYVAKPADPQVDGYWFTGWAKNGDVNDLYTSGAVASTAWTEDTYFVAQFVAAPEAEDGVQLTYQVTSPADGSYYEIISAANDEGYVAQPADPQVAGYWFTGWAVNGDTNNMMTSGAVASTQWTEDTYFVAQFVAEPEEATTLTYQVTSPADGAYYEIEATADENGYVKAPADPVVDGYWFTGWAVNGDTNNIFTSGAIGATQWTEDTYFVAQFVAEPTDEEAINVTYQVTSPADGSYYEIISPVDENGKVAQPADPVVPGYWFTGWAKNGNTDDMYTSGAVASQNYTEDTYYVAQFVAEPEELATYKVTFDDCLASTADPIIPVKEGQTIDPADIPADPTCNGYTFEGWFYDTALSQEFDPTAPITSDMTLYAKWTQNAEDPAVPGTDEGEQGGQTPTTPVQSEADQAATDEAAAEDEDALPQTGDSALPFAAGAAAIAGAAGIAAATAMRKRNSNR